MARTRSNSTSHLPRYVHIKHAKFYYFMRNNIWEKIGEIDATPLGELHAWLARKLGAAIETAAPKLDGVTIHELIDQTLDRVMQGRKKQGISAKSRENYIGAARMLKAECFGANIAAKAVTPRDLLAFRDEMLDEPGGFNMCITVLRGITEIGLLRGLIDYDFCAGVKMLPSCVRDRQVSHAEYLAIYHSKGATELSRIVQELAYRTGQRIGDVRRIRESQLLPTGIYFEQGKTGKELIIPWNTELRAVVERAKALSGWGNVIAIKGGVDRYLLAGRGNTPMSYEKCRDAFADAVKASGVEDVRIHDMRRKAATDKHRQETSKGRDGLLGAADLMGHGKDNVKTTKRHYLGVDTTVPVVEGPTGSVADLAAAEAAAAAEAPQLRPTGKTRRAKRAA